MDGRGAAQNPGRWNGPGIAVVYTAESPSLASLEVLVHTEDMRVLAAVKWATIPVGIDGELIEILDILPQDWRQLPAPQSTRELGSRWVAQSRSAVLQVPSIVVDGEFDYVLNPSHPDFSRLEIGRLQPFSFDPCLRRPGHFEGLANEQNPSASESRPFGMSEAVRLRNNAIRFA